jgi:hypothetical protein
VFETSEVTKPASPAQRVSAFLENWKIWGSPANLARLAIRVLLSGFIILVAFVLNLHTLFELFIVGALLLLINISSLGIPDSDS